MPDINPSIPVAGQPNSSEEPKVVTALTQLVAAVNDVDSAQILDATIATADIAALAVTDAKVAAATLTDSKLASPNNAVWRTYRSQPFFLGSTFGAATYLFTPEGHACASGGDVAAAVVYSSGSTASLRPVITPIMIPSLTDFAVAGKTAQGRVLAHLVTNGTVVGLPITFALYPITSLSGGANALVVGLAAAVAGSGAAVTPVASSAQQQAGAAFTLPSGSSYLLGCEFASGLPAGTVCSGSIDLQVRFT